MTESLDTIQLSLLPVFKSEIIKIERVFRELGQTVLWGPDLGT